MSPARLLLLAALLGCWCVWVSAARPQFVSAAAAVAARLGGDAHLECRVRGLADKTVSWVRSRDLQILVHAGAVFTADTRVSTTAPGAEPALGPGESRHVLALRQLRHSDAGRYECQLNTHPKMSLFFNLTVLDEWSPRIVVSALEGGRVRGTVDGSASLACSARWEPPPAPPAPTIHIQWAKDGRPIDLQSARGGVSLATERWEGRAAARLTLSRLAAADAGLYSCSAGDSSAHIQLHIDTESPMEAMQRDQSADSGAGVVTPALALTAIILLHLIAT